jgi:hypothetical protein
VLLDAATFWVLIRALGVTAPAGGVFISFMIAGYWCSHRLLIAPEPT